MTERAPASYWADICRGNLTAARAELCPCGIKRDRCTDHAPARREGAETTEEARDGR